MNAVSLLFLFSLASIAFCYAAVGHGGASGYIAMFALFGLVSIDMKNFVLTMNLVVAFISFFHYYQKGYFNLKFFLPFLAAAPMAYFGASLNIDMAIYHYILASFLLFSVIFLSGFFDHLKKVLEISYHPIKALFIAVILGFISGITGVGGGIFLSPILLIFGWQNLKETAAISSLFIVLNSAAGLLALQNTEVLLNTEILTKVLVVGTFGYLGSKWGVNTQKSLLLKRMLAFVLMIAAIKLCII
jgi:uncharacterized membrane protein YfcA